MEGEEFISQRIQRPSPTEKGSFQGYWGTLCRDTRSSSCCAYACSVGDKRDLTEEGVVEQREGSRSPNVKRGRLRRKVMRKVHGKVEAMMTPPCDSVTVGCIAYGCSISSYSLIAYIFSKTVSSQR